MSKIDTSVTTFGEFRDLGKNYAVFCNILRAHLVLGKILNLVSKIIFALRQFC